MCGVSGNEHLDRQGSLGHHGAMPEYSWTTDMAEATMSIDVVIPADVDRAFDLWADPRTLERWWGPPDFPCTVERFDMARGGRVTYSMTGPDGQRYPGWWEVIDVDRPSRLQIRDGFGDSPEIAPPEMPIATTVVTFTQRGTETLMKIHSTYESPAALQQALDMNMAEGFGLALAQIDDVLGQN
jgi:uncharacterized protein YndB with AHSA1/START domain